MINQDNNSEDAASNSKASTNKNSGLLQRVNKLNSGNSNSNEYKPKDLVTLPVNQIEELANLSNRVNISFKLPLEIDELLQDDQMKYRRKNQKRISKENLIISILKSHYKI